MEPVFVAVAVDVPEIVRVPVPLPVRVSVLVRVIVRVLLGVFVMVLVGVPVLDAVSVCVGVSVAVLDAVSVAVGESERVCVEDRVVAGVGVNERERVNEIERVAVRGVSVGVNVFDCAPANGNVSAASKVATSASETRVFWRGRALPARATASLRLEGGGGEARKRPSRAVENASAWCK